MKIGILGGSFNPPHKMHLEIALELIQREYVDRVIFVPTGKKYPKEGLLEDEMRYQMLKKMIKNYPCMLVSDYELGQRRVYTYQTLDYFQKQFPHDTLYFIMGMDNANDLENWKNHSYLIQKYHFLVLDREGETEKFKSCSSLTKVSIPLKEMSSTEIRKILKENREKSREMLEEEVYAYIEEKGLYHLGDE